MAWNLLYVLQMSKPQTFQELVAKAHDMEVTMANLRNISFSVVESKKDWDEFMTNAKFSISLTVEAMTFSKVGPVRILGKLKWKRKEACPSKTR